LLNFANKICLFQNYFAKFERILKKIFMKKTLLRLAFVALPMFGFAQTYFSDNFDDEDISD